MKEQILFILIPILLLSGCASNEIHVRHDVAISFDSERIAYDVVGTEKPALIFIHGWCCDSRYWQKQLFAFSKNYQVITIDLAGHGNSSANRIDYTMLSFAKDVRAVIDKEKINRTILIGHSMGGGVIAEAARIMPKKVIAIIGIDTLQNVAEKLPQKTLDKVVKPFELDFSNAMQTFVLPMFPLKADKKLIYWVKEDMSSAPQEVALSAFRNYAGQNINGEASKVFDEIPIPVVLINSRLWPTNSDENRKHIKNYKLFYIEETGHFSMLEKPEEFNKILTDALKYIELENNNKI
jgi:pimeloyl-ACP methyl ester carboxylesterase